MKKRFLSLLLALAAGLIVVCPLCVCAAGLETDADASMTLYYQKDGEAFPGLNIAIHRVAQALPDGSFALVAPFSSYPISIQIKEKLLVAQAGYIPVEVNHQWVTYPLHLYPY